MTVEAIAWNVIISTNSVTWKPDNLVFPEAIFTL